MLDLFRIQRVKILELNKISKIFGYGGAATVALDEVSLQIERGEFVAIMGPSGSGKTTLLNIIGLLDAPTLGSCSLSGQSIIGFSARRRAKIRREQIGFVFQSFNLLPNMSVLENVALPLAYSGKPYAKRLNMASDMLERLGIRKKEYLLPRQLSGGQIQRAAIGRALVNNPSIVVADEPTGNLDSESSDSIMRLLKDIHEAGNTILMVTHNPELTRYATRVIYMKDGQIRIDQELKKTQQVDLTKVQDVVRKEDKSRSPRRRSSAIRNNPERNRLRRLMRSRNSKENE